MRAARCGASCPDAGYRRAAVWTSCGRMARSAWHETLRAAARNASPRPQLLHMAYVGARRRTETEDRRRCDGPGDRRSERSLKGFAGSTSPFSASASERPADLAIELSTERTGV